MDSSTRFLLQKSFYVKLVINISDAETDISLHSLEIISSREIAI